MKDVVKCKNCNANVEVKDEQFRAFCNYCGSKVLDRGDVNLDTHKEQLKFVENQFAKSMDIFSSLGSSLGVDVNEIMKSTASNIKGKDTKSIMADFNSILADLDIDDDDHK